MTKVFLRQGESIENLLKRFRKRVTRDRVLSEAKKKRYFVSKSEQRRIAKRKADVDPVTWAFRRLLGRDPQPV